MDKIITRCLPPLLFFSLTLTIGCQGARLVKDSEPIQLTQPLAISADNSVTASLYWVIVRNGPGMWVENADWDEYLIAVSNHSGKDIQLDNVIVVDSLGTHLVSKRKLKKLVKESKETKKRYEDRHITMESGYQPSTLYGSAAASGAAAGATIGAYYGSMAPAAVGTGLLFAIAAVPVLVGAGVYRGHVNSKIDEKIEERSTSFPVKIPAGNNFSLDLFFPIAPSPRVVEIHYTSMGTQHSIAIDTAEALQDLHLPP